MLRMCDILIFILGLFHECLFCSSYLSNSVPHFDYCSFKMWFNIWHGKSLFFWNPFITFKKCYWYFLGIVLNPLSKHVLSTYCMPGSVLGTGNTAEKKAHPRRYDTYFLGKELGNKRAKISFQMEIRAIKKNRESRVRAAGWRSKVLLEFSGQKRSLKGGDTWIGTCILLRVYQMYTSLWE